MFTGIITAIGRVESLEQIGGDVRLRISSGKLDLDDVRVGDSIATNGVCLTAVELLEDGYVADVSAETLRKTTVGLWGEGTYVNLEKAMLATDRFGGHIVSGHVDGIGRVLERLQEARAEVFWIEAPVNLAKYIAQKGSITVDGTSLTVNDVDGARFALTIVPHTIEETVIADYQVGHKVNIEVDLVARYLEKLVEKVN